MRLEIEQTVPSLPLSENHAVENGSESPGVDTARLLKQGIYAAQTGDRGLARTLLFKVTEADPNNADAWLWLASISEYPEELHGFLGKVLAVDPDNERARQWQASTQTLLARTFVQRGVNAKADGLSTFAADCFEKALEYDNNCDESWIWKASLAATEAERVNCLERALNINAENEDAKAALQAIAAGRSQAKLEAARMAAVTGKRKKAESLLDEILENDPDSIDAWMLRSQVALPFEEKLLAYRRVLKLDDSNVFARAGHDYLADTMEWAGPADESSADKEQPPTSDSAPVEVPVAELHSDNVFEFQGNEHAESEVVPAKVHLIGDITVAEPFECREVLQDKFEPSQTETGEPDQEDVNKHFAAFRDAYQNEENHTDQAEFAALDEKPMRFDEPAYEVVPESVQVATEHPEPADSFDLPVPLPVDPFQYTADETTVEFENERVSEQNGHDSAEIHPCPYCGGDNEPLAFACVYCQAMLSLSDFESLLANANADREVISQSVANMEAEWNLREFSEQELTVLGIGQINLKNYERGLAYLQEASRLNPNNVILGGEVNAIAIRLDEMRRQNEVHDAMPKGKTILVVDDSATVRKLIASKLEKSGHNVVCAEDGVEAMSVIDKMVPDLVLLDIAMPRMDGYSVCKLIRSIDETKDIPVVMISGKDGFFDKVRGRMAGTTGYITKPFGPETLMRALETYLIPDAEPAEFVDAEPAV